MNIVKIILKVLLAIVIIYIAVQSIRCFIATKNSKKHLESYEAKSISLSYGNMNYIDKGTGDDIILSVHGICGGYDQGFDACQNFNDDYRIIAPSRFGYLGSDVMGDGSPSEQAKAYVELLDKLGIDKVYILATSAGGTVAIRFALDYPERTKGLILYCSAIPRLEKPSESPKYSGPPPFLCNDYAMFMISPLFPVVMGISEEKIYTLLPISERKEGIILDASITNGDMIRNFDDYHVEDLKVPTLILQSKDDKLVDYSKTEEALSRFPNCTYTFFETGGHLMVGHEEEVKQIVTNFIENTNNI